MQAKTSPKVIPSKGEAADEEPERHDVEVVAKECSEEELDYL